MYDISEHRIHTLLVLEARRINDRSEGIPRNLFDYSSCFRCQLFTTVYAEGAELKLVTSSIFD